MNRTEIDTLPPVVDVPTAGRILGLSRSSAYELVRTGAWPTPVVRLGRLIRVPTAPLLALLGVSDTDEPAEGPLLRPTIGVGG